MRICLMILTLVAAMALAACQKEQTTTTAPAERQNGTPGEQPPTVTAPATAPSATDQPGVAGGQGTSTPTGEGTSRPEAPREEKAAQTGAAGAGKITGSEGKTGGEPAESGQSPKFDQAPETIVLKASNGRVTLSHRKHAESMDCQTCHGDGTPGAIEGFAKERAHALCTGCHKEKGAGPTKCPDCHKKQ